MSNIRSIDIEPLAAAFKALSNPQRLRMFLKLATMCCGDSPHPAARAEATFCCAGELGTDLDLAASTVSHHLKELRQAGLMHVSRRGRKVDCRVNGDTLRWLTTFFEGCCGLTAAQPGVVSASRPRRGGRAG